MKHVVIVESPAKCKTINKYLGKDYHVLASYGHIRDLPSKNGSVLPEKDFEMNYYIPPESKKHTKAIEDAMKNADSLILATDPDREGEAISWHVYEFLMKQKIINKNFPVKRVSFNSITKDAVLKAMAAPRELDMDLVNSQQARRSLDYLVGFTLSPVLWRKIPGSRSAGRVQSVALRLICEREAEIEIFNAVEYWSVAAKFTTSKNEIFSAFLTHANGKKIDKLTIENEKQAKDILAAISGGKYRVNEVIKKRASRAPKAPFTTSTLQQEASRKLGFSASKTMQVAQKLYEGIQIGSEVTGVITYMRTDGVSIAPEAMDKTRTAIEKNYGKQYLPASPRIYKSKAKNAQEAHEAIRPTEPMRTPDSIVNYLDKDQYRLYDLIWKRLISSQMESALFDQVTAEISDDNKNQFRANGSTMVFDGFLKIYNEGTDDEDDDSEESRKLPILQEKDKLDFAKTENANPEAEQHFTQPPPRYNEASLVKKLEELGIGRPSTYASIISILINRKYVKIDKKRFYPEPRGRVVTGFLNQYFKHYVEYDFTANLEDELDLISDGKIDWKKVLHNFWGDFKTTIDSAMEITITDVVNLLDKELEVLIINNSPNKSRTCPKCNDGNQGLKFGKFGPFIGCSNYPTCDYTAQFEQDSGSNDDDESQEDAVKKAIFEDKVLGTHPQSQKEIALKKGPYGFYVQEGQPEGKNKPRRASIPRGVNIDDVTLEKALELLSLPRTLGTDNEVGEVIAGLGRFGPYISAEKRFYSIKPDQLLSITLDEALVVIEEGKKKPRREKPVKKGAAAPAEEKKVTAKKTAPKKTPAKKSITKSAPKKALKKAAKK